MDKEKKETLKNPQKCGICKKKKMILLMCSHCESMFCIKHTCPESHSCKYDFKYSFQLPEKPKIQKVEVI